LRRHVNGPESASENPDEPGPALIDLFQAYCQGILLVGYTPAEINGNQVEMTIAHPLPQFRESNASQMVSLCMHVYEGRADKKADGLPTRGS
jgi:hypothetical protein